MKSKRCEFPFLVLAVLLAYSHSSIIIILLPRNGRSGIRMTQLTQPIKIYLIASASETYGDQLAARDLLTNAD